MEILFRALRYVETRRNQNRIPKLGRFGDCILILNLQEGVQLATVRPMVLVSNPFHVTQQ